MTRIKSKKGKYGRLEVGMPFEMTPAQTRRMQKRVNETQDKLDGLMDDLLTQMIEKMRQTVATEGRFPTKKEMKRHLELWEETRAGLGNKKSRNGG